MKEFKRHALSAIAGDMAPSTFVELSGDVSQFGVLEPVVIFEGEVLDGWHRYRAWRDALALKADVRCEFVEFSGDVPAAAAFVRSKHLRRDWTPSQRALAAVALDEYVRAGGKKGRTVSELAEEANVGERLISQARTVTRNAIPEVKAAAEDGTMSLKEAESIAKKKPAEQAKAVKQAKEPKPRKPASPGWRAADAPMPRVGVTMEAHKQLEENNSVLAEEVDRLTARCAVHFMEGTEDEKAAAAELITDLQKQVRLLEVENRALKSSRDTYMTEASELRKQCGMYRNQLSRKAA